LLFEEIYSPPNKLRFLNAIQEHSSRSGQTLQEEEEKQPDSIPTAEEVIISSRAYDEGMSRDLLLPKE
jgi:hypothetical protein